MSIDAALREAERERTSPGRRPAVAIFLILWVLWGTLLVWVRMQHPGLSVGEDWGDADILNAGRFFDQHGYSLTKGLPRLDTAPLRPGEKPVTYNSFPPGPFWIHQGLKAVGITDLATQRALHEVYTHLGELLLFFVICRFTGSAWLALFAAGLHMFSIPYAAYSSGFWVNMGQTPLFGALYCWKRYEDAPRAEPWFTRASVWLALAALLAFADFWITFEDGPFIAIVVGVRALMIRRRRTFLAAVAVAFMPALVMIIRTIYTAWAMDVGLSMAVQHFIAAGEARSGEGNVPTAWSSVWSVWLSRLGWPLTADPNAWHNRTFMYPVLWPVVIVPAVVLVGVLTSRLDDPRIAPARRGFWTGVLFLFAGVSWTVIMRGHVWHHRFTILTLMPGFAVLLASLAYAGLALRPRGELRVRFMAWLPAVAAMVVLIALPMSLRYSDLLNLRFTLDEHRAERSHESERFYALDAATHRGLEWAKRVIVYPKRPMISYYLDVPFVHAGAAAPEGLPSRDAGEAWLLDTWAPEAGKLAARLAKQIGLPDVQGDGGRLVVFPAHAGVSLPIEAAIEGLGHVEGVRVAPTLDGGSMAVIFGVSGTLKPAANRFVFGTIALDDAGHEIARSGSRLAWTGCFDNERGFAWATLPLDELRAARSIRLSIWDTRSNSAAAWQIARDLPEHATLLSNRAAVDLDAATWSARRLQEAKPGPVPPSKAPEPALPAAR